MINPLSQTFLSNPPRWHQPLTSAFDVLNAANETEPNPEYWGYLAHHSGNACGPPVSFGVFLWFASFEEMLQALVQGELRMEWDNDELDAAAQADVRKMQMIADRLAENPHERSKACDDFSKVLDFLELEWIGQFKELTTGNSNYAREVRMLFRELSEKEDDASPIQTEEQPDFIDTLRTWSI